ncbi:MAG: phosphocarrier protein HPr [Phycisphaerales bacterium]
MSDRCAIIVTIKNRLGLHARPAMAFVDTASQFPCAVRIQKGEESVDGKSVMEIMLLAATQGTELQIHLQGKQAKACGSALKALVDRGFDED